MKSVILILFWLLLQAPSPAIEAAEAVPNGPLAGTLVGENEFRIVGPGETMMEIARESGVGFRNLMRANPGLDPWNPEPGRSILIPRAAIVPEEAGPGITINLAEMRLYLLWKERGEWKVRIYPVGIGQEGWATPVGLFHITCRVERPIWTVPEAIRREDETMPRAVPPGPENPLGEIWLGLSAEGYGIHGTNRPLGIGRRVSHGCIRLYPEDILELASRVPVGTPVRIIDRPFKVARMEEGIFLESHLPAGKADASAQRSAEELGKIALLLQGGDDALARKILRQGRGIPLPVTTR